MNGSGCASIEIQPICGVALTCCAHVNRGSKQLSVAPTRNTRRVELMAEASGAEYNAPPVATAWGQRASYRDRREARRAPSEHIPLSRLPNAHDERPWRAIASHRPARSYCWATYSHSIT